MAGTFCNHPRHHDLDAALRFDDFTLVILAIAAKEPKNNREISAKSVKKIAPDGENIT